MPLGFRFQALRVFRVGSLSSYSGLRAFRGFHSWHWDWVVSAVYGSTKMHRFFRC